MRVRTALALGGIALALGACVSSQPPQLAARVSGTAPSPVVPPEVAARYGAINDRFAVAAVDPSELEPEYVRQLVDFSTREPPGTVVVDTSHRWLYLVMPGGKALRYGVGVGKEGLAFKGKAEIGRKAQWPHWTPTPDMIRREPRRYAKWVNGMDGGSHNPLGARALYLFKNGNDTLFRIHGTTEPWTIGHAVSSGCIRMMNQDVIDLYSRVPSGSKVVVL